MCIKNKRKKNKPKNQYSQQVQKYFNDNSFLIIQRIQSGMLNDKKINNTDVRNVFGSYPKAPDVNKCDYICQFVSMLTEIGYPIENNTAGYVSYKNSQLCKVIIKYYLSLNGKEIMDRFAECCMKTNGKISYEQARIALGFDYVKTDSALKTNIDECTLLFIKQMGLPFKHNSTHIYLP